MVSFELSLGLFSSSPTRILCQRIDFLLPGSPRLQPQVVLAKSQFPQSTSSAPFAQSTTKSQTLFCGIADSGTVPQMKLSSTGLPASSWMFCELPCGLQDIDSAWLRGTERVNVLHARSTKQTLALRNPLILRSILTPACFNQNEYPTGVRSCITIR